MAYLVSQMRKNQSTTYMSTVSVSPSTITSPNTFGGSETFTDFALSGSFESGKVYYLRFQIHRIPQYFFSGSKTAGQVSMYRADADDLSLQILLKNDGEDDENSVPPEIIGTCTVPRAQRTESQKYSSYSFVFSPSKNFNRLGFRINRVSFDAINTNKPRNWLTLIEKIKDDDYLSGSTVSGTRWTDGDSETITVVGPRIIYDGNDGDVCTLNNLVDQQAGWLKIGYQCRPGSLIVVNGEPIRLGRSGIYQINNGTIIQNFMIASPGGSDSSKIDAFLLDYAYKG